MPQRPLLGVRYQATNGYAQELYTLEPEFAVPVDAELGDLGVLVEPASVVAKAGTVALHILQRSAIPPRTALITGAGPIGLLAALATTQYGLDTYVVDIVESGRKPDLGVTWARRIMPVRSTS